MDMALNLPFAQALCDRVEFQRDAASLAAFMRDSRAQCLNFYRGRVALDEHMRPILTPPEPADNPLLLGTVGGRAVFARALSAPRADIVESQFQDLRMVGGCLAADDLALIGYGRALLDWHYHHRFCAQCGQVSDIAEGGLKRLCVHCQTEHFPRVNPVAIMLVIHQDQCLLGRGHGWPEGSFSALAGFVSPGENLENACLREVAEEVDVHAHSPRYIFSQFWPWPSQLMLALICQTDNLNFKCNAAELAEARWFSRATVKAVLEKRSEAFQRLPKITMAYHLLHYWVNE